MNKSNKKKAGIILTAILIWGIGFFIVTDKNKQKARASYESHNQFRDDYIARLDESAVEIERKRKEIQADILEAQRKRSRGVKLDRDISHYRFMLDRAKTESERTEYRYKLLKAMEERDNLYDYVLHPL